MLPYLRIIVLLSFYPLCLSAQTDFRKGFVVTSDGEKIEGRIKLPGKLKGSLTLLTSDDQKKTYSPVRLKSFTIDSVNYITYSNDFYEEIAVGARASLYKKLTDNRDQKIYNGVEVLGFVKTTEGKAGDYYVRSANEVEMDLIRQKNFKDYFIRLANDNLALLIKIKDGTLGYLQIETIVKMYNN